MSAPRIHIKRPITVKKEALVYGALALSYVAVWSRRLSEWARRLGTHYLEEAQK